MAPPLRVLTFNLRRDVEADGPNRWPHRRDLVAGVVRARAPHLVATQEGLPHQLEDLDGRLAGWRRVGGCRRGDGTDEACALWWDPERLRMLDWGEFWLSDAPERAGSATWGNAHPRLVTWARLEDRARGREVRVANTHLDHRSSRARLLSARMLARRLPGFLLAGDFNAAPASAPHDLLRAAGWTDPFGEDAVPGTYHGFTGLAAHRIDWILAPRGVEVRDAEVVRERPGGRYPSDHWPVVADVA